MGVSIFATIAFFFCAFICSLVVNSKAASIDFEIGGVLGLLFTIIVSACLVGIGTYRMWKNKAGRRLSWLALLTCFHVFFIGICGIFIYHIIGLIIGASGRK